MSGATAGHDLAARSWPDVRPALVLLPIGSTEQHGPHLPFSTDTRIATAVADQLASRARSASIECVVAPPLAYGASGEHQDFPGTVSLGTPALALALLELGRSLSTWARRVVFVNAHGGNRDALADAVPRLRSESRDAAWLPCAPPRPADAHAGLDETSLLLHLAPHDVRPDRAQPGAGGTMTDLLPRLRAEGVRAISPNGVLGDPTGASAERGAALFSAMCDLAWGRLQHGAAGADGCLAPPPAPPHDGSPA